MLGAGGNSNPHVVSSDVPYYFRATVKLLNLQELSSGTTSLGMGRDALLPQDGSRSSGSLHGLH